MSRGKRRNFMVSPSFVIAPGHERAGGSSRDRRAGECRARCACEPFIPGFFGSRGYAERWWTPHEDPGVAGISMMITTSSELPARLTPWVPCAAMIYAVIRMVGGTSRVGGLVMIELPLLGLWPLLVVFQCTVSRVGTAIAANRKGAYHHRAPPSVNT